VKAAEDAVLARLVEAARPGPARRQARAGEPGGAGGVWVANAGDGTVSLVSGSRNRVVGAPIPVGRSADWVSIGFDSIWVSDPYENTVTRIEPR